ncbi:MAG: TSUP family transporter [Verrucomicrobia bacterium]|nr:TSUP family transporter [Verrucomicrobiota bacterium]
MLEVLDMHVVDVAAAGAIICFAVTAQAAVGFGSALFAIPLLVLLGIPLPNIIVLVYTCSMMQTVIGARKLREDVPWRPAFAAISVMTVGLVLGLVLLSRLANLNKDTIRLAVGCVLALIVVAQIVIRPKPVATLHPAWGAAAFVSAGFLGGACGMNGPPLVLWSMAHDWSNAKTRGFLFAVFSMANPIQIALLTVTFGPSVLWFAVLGVGFLPLVYLGSTLGLPIGNRMKKDTLKTCAFGLLLVIAASAVVPAALKWARGEKTQEEAELRTALNRTDMETAKNKRAE